MDQTESNYTRIYAIVSRIPCGRVATYGQIATIAGLPGHARQVGYALAATPNTMRIPWHRVINARGEVSQRSDPFEHLDNEQRQRLEAEGIAFNEHGRVSLDQFRWRPRAKLR